MSCGRSPSMLRGRRALTKQRPYWRAGAMAVGPGPAPAATPPMRTSRFPLEAALAAFSGGADEHRVGGEYVVPVLPYPVIASVGTGG